MISCKSTQSACRAHIRPIKFATFGDKRWEQPLRWSGELETSDGLREVAALKCQTQPVPVATPARSEGVIKILLCTLQYQKNIAMDATRNPMRKCVTCECDDHARAQSPSKAGETGNGNGNRNGNSTRQPVRWFDNGTRWVARFISDCEQLLTFAN